MGLYRTLRENDGVHIQGNGVSLDVIVREISLIQDTFKKAYLEVQNQEENYNFSIAEGDSLYKITSDVKVQVRTRTKSTNRKVITLNFCAPIKYHFNFKHYER
jgi:hypothetical protein